MFIVSAGRLGQRERYVGAVPHFGHAILIDRKVDEKEWCVWGQR